MTTLSLINLFMKMIMEIYIVTDLLWIKLKYIMMYCPMVS